MYLHAGLTGLQRTRATLGNAGTRNQAESSRVSNCILTFVESESVQIHGNKSTNDGIQQRIVLYALSAAQSSLSINVSICSRFSAPRSSPHALQTRQSPECHPQFPWQTSAQTDRGHLERPLGRPDHREAGCVVCRSASS